MSVTSTTGARHARWTASDPAALLDALDALHGRSPEYRGFLANHGPMAVDALIRLGGAGRAASWVARYRRDLVDETPRGDGAPPTDWAAALGDIGRLAGWTELFRRELAEHGWRVTLAVWWPRLLPGAAASATHGIIRTAHAVRNLAEHGDDEPLLVGELAEALGYWAARYQTLPGAPTLRGQGDLDAAIAGLPRLDPTVPSAGPGIGGRLAALGAVTGLPAALDSWGPTCVDERTLDELIGAAAQVLASRRDSPVAFCHAVTAPAAVRMILGEIPAEHRPVTIAACWQLVGAIVSAFASPSGHEDRRAPWADAPSAAQLARRAVQHGDEHVLKLTEACLRQFATTGDEMLLVAADRFSRRLSPRR